LDILKWVHEKLRSRLSATPIHPRRLRLIELVCADSEDRHTRCNFLEAQFRIVSCIGFPNFMSWSLVVTVKSPPWLLPS
jgi:hypothetical protein